MVVCKCKDIQVCNDLHSSMASRGTLLRAIERHQNKKLTKVLYELGVLSSHIDDYKDGFADDDYIYYYLPLFELGTWCAEPIGQFISKL